MILWTLHGHTKQQEQKENVCDPLHGIGDYQDNVITGGKKKANNKETHCCLYQKEKSIRTLTKFRTETPSTIIFDFVKTMTLGKHNIQDTLYATNYLL